MNLSFDEVVPFSEPFIWWDIPFDGSIKGKQTTAPQQNQTTSPNETIFLCFIRWQCFICWGYSVSLHDVSIGVITKWSGGATAGCSSMASLVSRALPRPQVLRCKSPPLQPRLSLCGAVLSIGRCLWVCEPVWGRMIFFVTLWLCHREESKEDLLWFFCFTPQRTL